MTPLATDWLRLRNILVLLLVFSFCLYLPTLFHYGFADDDIYLAYANRFLRLSNWTELYQLFLKPANPWEFLPLRDFTYWLDFRIYGDELSGFHATNLLWYGASGAAVYGLFRELIRLCRPAWTDHASILALCGTLLFMVHPAHVEVVAWIASRKDLIAATLQFMSLALLARALRRGWPVHLLLSAALLLFAACFGKGSAMTGIVVATALFTMVWNASPEIAVSRKFTLLLSFWALITLAFVIHLQVGASHGIRIENHPGMFVMFDRASRILVSLIGIVLFPYPLHLYHDVYRLGDWHWLVSTSLALLGLASLWRLSISRSLWAIGVVLMLAPLAVYLQLMPFTTWSLASERFVFVSVAGLALVLIDVCGRIASANTITTLLLVIVLPCAFLVWSRVDEWEYKKNLLEREYTLQPDFHNAIRDHIVFTLLPERRYTEAAVLARQLERPYAVDVLLALINAEGAFQLMNDARRSDPKKVPVALRHNFCSTVENLRSAIDNGYAHTPNEPDISYNNILRNAGWALKYQYADSKAICPQTAPGRL